MVDRVQVGWSGFQGGPGVSTFYVTDGAASLTAIRSFFVACAGNLPADVRIAVPSSGDILDPISGLITGGWTGTGSAPVPGTASGGYSAASGVLVRWETGQIRRGRRVRGRTFLVPTAANTQEDDGTLLAAAQSAIQAGASALVTSLATNLFVLQRHFPGSPSWTDVRGKVHSAKAVRSGEAIAVTTAVVPDKLVILRSRRD